MAKKLGGLGLFLPGAILTTVGMLKFLPIDSTANAVVIGLGAAGIIGGILKMLKIA